MEGNENQYENRSSSKLGWYFLLTMIAIIVAGVVMYWQHDNIAKLINPEKQEIVCTDTASIAVEPVRTIQDVLQFRKDIREGERIDSIFMSIPDVVLIDILMNHGTSLSNGDIVYIYESNKSTYNTVLRGTEVQKFYEDSVLKQPRDSLRSE